MGYSYGTVCMNCNKETEYLLGFGFLRGPMFESIIDNVMSPKLKRHVQLLENEHNGNVEEDISHGLYECPQCKTLKKRLNFKIRYDEDKEFTPLYNCGKCKSILLPIDLDNDSESELSLLEFKCSRCGEKALEESLSVILWD